MDVLHKLTQIENSLSSNKMANKVFWINKRIKEELLLKRNELIINVDKNDKEMYEKIGVVFNNFDFEFTLDEEKEQQIIYKICWNNQ